ATATGLGGTGTQTATLNVSNLAATLSASPTSLPSSGTSTLSYNITTDPGQTVAVSIDNGVGNLGGNATGTVTTPTLNNTTTFTLTATESPSGISTTAQVTVTVGNMLASSVKHIIFLLQENHSFDNYFGKLGIYRANDPFTGQSYGQVSDVDGIPNDSAFTIKDHSGKPLNPHHLKTLCVDNTSPSWDESHVDVDKQSNGSYKMDGFANGTASSMGAKYDPAGRRSMGYYDWTDFPYYYELATQYATSDRWFAPALANTPINRMYSFAATSYGTTYPEVPTPNGFAQPVIFDSLSQNNISWSYYTQPPKNNAFLGSYNRPNNPNFSKDGLGSHYQDISNLLRDLADPQADSKLASVIFIDTAQPITGNPPPALDEHPGDGQMQFGAANTANIINTFLASPAYASSVFILTYDEPGGLYDHVPPQPMPPPDNQPPSLQSPDGKTQVINAPFDTTGMRVPVIVISPWVKPHYVSHVVRDYTAILKLIEKRFNLSSLTARDAAQDDMTEMFDFSHPSVLVPPKMPTQPTNGTCNASIEAQ
ncbi:MAG: hypothetical protein JOZ43_05350, partial [Acidobacteriales bacterium]|nr:hypothetical protein [Terriglobales bacterium]